MASLGDPGILQEAGGCRSEARLEFVWGRRDQLAPGEAVSVGVGPDVGRCDHYSIEQNMHKA